MPTSSCSTTRWVQGAVPCMPVGHGWLRARKVLADTFLQHHKVGAVQCSRGPSPQMPAARTRVLGAPHPRPPPSQTCTCHRSPAPSLCPPAAHPRPPSAPPAARLPAPAGLPAHRHLPAGAHRARGHPPLLRHPGEGGVSGLCRGLCIGVPCRGHPPPLRHPGGRWRACVLGAPHAASRRLGGARARARMQAGGACSATPPRTPAAPSSPSTAHRRVQPDAAQVPAAQAARAGGCRRPMAGAECRARGASRRAR